VSAATNALEDALLNLLLNNVALPFSLAGVHVGLSTSVPTDAGSTSGEPVGAGYARQPVTGLFTVSGGGVGQAFNNVNVEFPIATGSWGTITHAFLITASSGGTMLVHSVISAGTPISINQVARLLAGALIVTAA
jgi:hypothetical protein